MFSFASKTTDPGTKLGWNDRIGYGMGNFGMAWVNGMMSAFLMKYLTDVSLVDAGVVSLIIAISKLFDGVSDLIMGRNCRRNTFKAWKSESMADQNVYSTGNFYYLIV